MHILNKIRNIILVLVLVACPSNPSNSDIFEDENQLGSEIIGTTGGSISSDNFVLTVPSGAFDTTIELNLFASQTITNRFGNETSEEIILEGLPDQFHKPLRIAINHGGQAAGESFIAVGLDIVDDDEEVEEIPYFLIPAIDSSGYLVSYLDLPSNSNSKLSKKFSTDYKYHVLAIWSHVTYTSPNGNFIIHFPDDVLSKLSSIELLGRSLDEAYDIFQNLGFDYTNLIPRKPIRVYIENIPVKNGEVDEPDGLFTHSWLWDYVGWLTININMIIQNDTEKIRTSAGHEFFHYVQSLYDNRDTFFKAKYESDHYWIDEAVSTWSEGLFVDYGGYNPPIRNPNQLAPLNGLQYGKDVLGAQKHGYGMSGLIKYLAEKHGNEILVEAYRRIKNGINPAEALYRIDGGGWWHSFMMDYLEDKLYTDISTPNLYANTSGEMQTTELLEDGAIQYKIIFNLSYPDLSGRLFHIDLNYPDTFQNIIMDFTASSIENSHNIAVYRYSNQGKSLDYLGSGTNQITIPNIINHQNNNDNRNDLLVLVTNDRAVVPYTDYQDVKLEVIAREGESGGPILDALHRTDNIYYADISRIPIRYNWSDNIGNSGTNIEFVQDQRINLGVYTEFWNYHNPLSWTNDTTFSAIYEASANNNTYYYELVGIVSIGGKILRELTIKENTTYWGGNVKELQFTLHDIPVSSFDINDNQFDIIYEVRNPSGSNLSNVNYQSYGGGYNADYVSTELGSSPGGLNEVIYFRIYQDLSGSTPYNYNPWQNF